jgi:hypothetical protein
MSYAYASEPLCVLALAALTVVALGLLLPLSSHSAFASARPCGVLSAAVGSITDHLKTFPRTRKTGQSRIGQSRIRTGQQGPEINLSLGARGSEWPLGAGRSLLILYPHLTGHVSARTLARDSWS